jgi:hypothetical protein
MKPIVLRITLAAAAIAFLWWVHWEYGWPHRSLTQEEQWDFNSLDNYVNDLENPTPLNANIRRVECEDPERSVAHWKSIGAGHNKLRRFIAGCARNH